MIVVCFVLCWFLFGAEISAILPYNELLTLECGPLSRKEGVSIWVVPSSAITASSPDEKEILFDPSDDKVYRHASFYKLPDEVGHM